MKDNYLYWSSNCTSVRGEAFLGKYQDELADTYLIFRDGNQIQQFPLYWLQVTEKGYIADFIPNVLGLLICSPRLVEALNELKIPNLEFFPVLIKVNEAEIHGYQICNIVGTVEALDIGQTDFNILDAGGGSVLKLVRWPILKEKFETSLEIFRLSESKGWIFISKKVAKILKSKKLTGLYFDKLGSNPMSVNNNPKN